MSYDRDEVACDHCFDHKQLKRWIRDRATKRGLCPWCGKKGALIDLSELSEMFREVASLFEPIEGPDAYERGEFISSLLDDHWGVFSAVLHDRENTAQELVVAILYADIEPKERVDCPDYTGFFVDPPVGSLEGHWAERAYEVLSGAPGAFDQHTFAKLKQGIAEEFPAMSAAFEDLSDTVPAGQMYYRARVQDRGRTARYAPQELGAPPPGKAGASRASRQGEPVLYLATDRTTALAEVRAWKGAVVAIAEVRLREDVWLVDLSRPMKIRSPFFVDSVKWRMDLAGLLHRLSTDLSRPVLPKDAEIIYQPTQFLALMIKANGYDGLIHPSAMGPGRNVVLFDPAKGEVQSVSYSRVRRVAYLGPRCPIMRTWTSRDRMTTHFPIRRHRAEA
jgi:RES domain-containing protein